MNAHVRRTRKASAIRAGTTTTPSSGSSGDRPHPGDGVLDRLPPEEREVMILSHFYGLARDEIAAIIGASVDGVDRLLSHALEHLRRRFQGPRPA